MPHKIIIRCPNWVGDVVMATPVFDCLKKNFPKARLIGLVKKGTDRIVEHGPWFDQIMTINDKTTKGFIKTIRFIRDIKPDMAILLPNSTRSILEMRLGGAKNIYGYGRGGRSFLLSGGPKPVRQGKKILPLPMVEYYMGICRWMGLEVPEKVKPSLYFSESVNEQGNRLLEKYDIRSHDLVIGFNPGAKFGSSKCWPPEYFARVAELFEDAFHCKLLLFVGPGEEDLADAIMEKTRAHLINTAPDKVDLAVLKPLIKRCQLLVTNDTGPRHYAVAFDIPVVVIMGPTDPRYTASNLDNTIVLRQDMACSPCHKKECPYDHSCMTNITPDMVFEAGKKLLNKSNQS